MEVERAHFKLRRTRYYQIRLASNYLWYHTVRHLLFNYCFTCWRSYVWHIPIRLFPIKANPRIFQHRRMEIACFAPPGFVIWTVWILFSIISSSSTSISSIGPPTSVFWHWTVTASTILKLIYNSLMGRSKEARCSAIETPAWPRLTSWCASLKWLAYILRISIRGATRTIITAMFVCRNIAWWSYKLN